MKLQDLIEEIKFTLTGGVLELELDDAQIMLAVNQALREIGRYWDETTLVTLPYASCIDLSNSDLDLKEKVSAIVKVYRTEGAGNVADSTADPLYMQQFLIFSNGATMYNVNDYILNFTSYSLMQSIRNTLSTDMAFKEDRHNNKLYINGGSLGNPNTVTIEYIPKLTSVDQVKSDYWIDQLIKMSVATTKIVLGRIRTRFSQTNALWTQDGEKLLEEGNTDLKELREVLRSNDNLIVGID